MNRPAIASLLGPGAAPRAGVVAVCSAHPLVIEAALRVGRSRDEAVLIEATCNQVNPEGGYTGMTPTDFRDFVARIAADVGFDPARLKLGGDHLGPNPWRRLPAREAMARAEAMVAAYARAGFRKLHLDASMGCAGEPPALADAVAADRAARLAAAAEQAAGGAISYVIGTEVPTPGGAAAELEAEVTTPEAAEATLEAHRDAFRRLGLEEAFTRVVALVVQPGVEFGGEEILHYDSEKAQRLREFLVAHPQLAFEAHSTDYQRPGALARLVEDGFAVLKVGPALTFALREALYGLDGMAETLGGVPGSRLQSTMERLMVEDPRWWADYYRGDEEQQRHQRHFSLSDRIRYYWSRPEAVEAVELLLERINHCDIPTPLAHQYLRDVEFGDKRASSARELVRRAIERVLLTYASACEAEEHSSLNLSVRPTTY